MTSAKRVLLTVLLACGAMVIGLLLARNTVGELGNDGLTGMGWISMYHQERNRNRVLDERRRQMNEVVGAKRTIAIEVIADRMTLRQAVAQFLAVCRDSPYCWDYLGETKAGLPPEFRSAQYIVEEVDYQLQAQGKNSAHVLARLRTEIEGWQPQPKSKDPAVAQPDHFPDGGHFRGGIRTRRSSPGGSSS
jgi:hypothetical protein